MDWIIKWRVRFASGLKYRVVSFGSFDPTYRMICEAGLMSEEERDRSMGSHAKDSEVGL